MVAGSPPVLELDAEMRSRVERLASERQQPVDAMLREALEQFVEREEKHDQFRQAALSAWGEYEASGLHATAEEVDAWLSRLEAGQEIAPPKCHG